MSAAASAGRVLRVGVDLDGVVYDFAGSLRAYLVSTGRDPQELPDPSCWNFGPEWGLTADEFVQACCAGVDTGWVFRFGGPLPGVRDGLVRLRAAGHEVHIVTARSFGAPGRAEKATRAWLAEHDLPFDTITFARDKTSVATDVFIDDFLGNYDATAAAGSRAYLREQPYNQVGPGEVDGRRRVASFAEFVDDVLRFVGNQPA